MLSNSTITLTSRPRYTEAALFALGALAVAAVVLMPQAGLPVLGLCVAIGFFMVVADLLQGRVEQLLLCWAVIFPLDAVVDFPRERSIITIERIIIVLACIGLLFVRPRALTAVPKPLCRVAFACLAFIAAAAVTLVKAPDVLNAARYLVDSFLDPLLFGWCVIAWFAVRRRLRTLHTAVCISSLFCASVAAAEIVTRQDLLPMPGSQLDFAAGIPRPNGPFPSNDQLALIGGVSFFLLLFLRVALGPRVSTGRKFFHFIGATSALGMALMPMFRSVAMTLLLILIIDMFWEQKGSRRAVRAVLLAGFFGLILSIKLFAPDVFADRSTSDNGYARVAEYEQSLKVFTDYPVLGVGFHNFNNFVAGESRYRMFYKGVGSVDWPHSNLASILTETGLLGFLPYLLLQLLLIKAMWDLRRTSAAGRLVWKYFCYLFLVYWITGLTESSGFAPLNLWYAFALMVLYKYAMTAPDAALPEDSSAPAQEFATPAHAFSAAMFR